MTVPIGSPAMDAMVVSVPKDWISSSAFSPARMGSNTAALLEPVCVAISTTPGNAVPVRRVTPPVKFCLLSNPA